MSKPALQIARRNLSHFDENSVISFLNEIFRSLNALSTPFYTTNIAHDSFSVGTIPTNRKKESFKFRLNSVISFLIVKFRRFNALSTPFYTPNVEHDNFNVGSIPAYRKTQSFKFPLTLCYFDPDCDISAIKHSFHSILHAEISARQFQRRHNSCISHNAIFQILSLTLLHCS
jgi:hypothetical protein